MNNFITAFTGVSTLVLKLRHCFAFSLLVIALMAKAGDPPAKKTHVENPPVEIVLVEKTTTGCSVDGPTPVNRYSSATYFLNGTICATPASWTTSCGAIIDMAVDGFTVYFNDPSCTSATITAYTSGGKPIASKSISINPTFPLNGGTINNTSQTINYNTTPSNITCSNPSYGTGSYSYLWYYSNDNSTFYSTGVTTQEYPPGALVATRWFKRLTQSGYQSAYSNTAVVNVYPQLFSGTASPGSQTINYNTAPAGLSVSSPSGGSGSYSYQWQSSSSPGGPFSGISGATGATYYSGALTATTYFNVVTNSNGALVTSNTVTVNVYPELIAGSVSPGLTSINYNTNPGQLSVGGISGGNSSYTYQWQSSPNNSSWSDIPGATGSVYSPGNMTTSTYFRVAVTSNGVTAYSVSGRVNVYPQLNPGYINGGNVLLPKFSAMSNMINDSFYGGNGSYTFQWQSSQDNSAWSNIQGATSISYGTGVAANIKRYFRMVVTSNGVSIPTASVLVDVLDGGSVSPSALSINYGTSPGQLSVSGVTGGTCTYTYQWQRSASPDFSSPVNESGATASAFTPGNLTSTTYYRVAVTCSGVTAYSASAKVTVYPALQAPVISPSSQTINYSTSPSAFTISTYPTGGNGSYTYDWQYSASSGGPFSSTGQTGTSFTESAQLTANRYYKLVVNSNGAITGSSVVTVNVLPQIQPGVVSPVTSNVNYNTTPGTLTLSNVSGGNGSYTYVWQSSPDNTFNNPATVQTGGTTFTVPSLTATTYYRVAVTSNGATRPSAYATVNVYPQLQAGTITPSNQTINYNGTPNILTLTGTSGGNGSYTYFWQKSKDNTFNPADSVAYGVSSITPYSTGTAYYRVIVGSNGVNVTSGTAQATVYPPLQIADITPVSQWVYSGSQPISLLQDGVTGGNGTYSYQWRSSPDGITWTPISGAIYYTYNPGATNVPGTTYYRLTVSSNGVSVNSNVSEIHVVPHVNPGEITTPARVIDAGMDVGTINATAATQGICGGSYSYVWETSTDGISFTPTVVTTQNYPAGVINTTTYIRRKVTCGSEKAYTKAVQVYVERLADFSSFNYLRTRDVTRKNVADEANADALTDPYEVRQTTQYFDGLGRPMQTVSRQASPSLTDMISVQLYDDYGRESSQFLPYTASASANGNIKLTPLSDQLAFNAAQFPSENYYSGSTSFERSPLNRTVAIYAPGNSWIGSQRGVTSQYLFNLVSDSVQQWSIASTPGSIPVSAGAYPAGMLTKTITTDEASHQVVEFSDKEGHVILKKVQALEAPGLAHHGWACTYYIYDQVGNLRYVLQPNAVKLIKTNWVVLQLVVDDLSFCYEYDARNRVIFKKVPGAKAQVVVYDRRDRVVMTQNAEQKKNNQWSFTKYDSLNRPVITGLYILNTTQAGMSALVDSPRLNEVYNGSPSNHGYSNNVYPTTGAIVLTVTYYDHYRFKNGWGSTFNYVDDALSYNGYTNVAPDTLMQGQVTGTKTKVLDGGNTYLRSIIYYDKYYHAQQTISEHYRAAQASNGTLAGGTDRVSNLYDFAGQLIKTKTTHIPKSLNSITEDRRIDYDQAGRTKAMWHTMNGQEVQLTASTYNALGQLATKSLHSRNASPFIQNIDYAYNIRGWLDNINDPNAMGTTDLFSMDLNYDQPEANGGTAQYNGNISQVIWTTAGSAKQSYGYAYDAMNRLTQASFYNHSNSLLNGKFNEIIGNGTNRPGYDLNGNILNLFRYGRKDAAGSLDLMDDLAYTYTGNRLTRVDDAIALNSGEDGFKENVKTANEYTYDDNGSMNLDQNKGITGIVYNHLLLPLQVNKGASDYIVYVYDASGRKLTQQVYGTDAKTTDYVGGYIYENNSLQFINHEEGRVVMTGTAPEYQYHLKDHLGNVRLTFTEKNEIENAIATLETANLAAEQSKFLRIENARRINAAIFDHTNGTADGYSQRLTGSANEIYGLARSLSVMPGDTIKVEVFAKYVDADESVNWTQSLTNLMAAIQSGTGGVTTDGASYSTSTSSFIHAGNVDYSNSSGSAPKAFLNWIIFNRDFELRDAGFIQISGAAMENGTNVPHERLAKDNIIVREPGYAYIYLSNEETQNPVEVFFDDFRVEHVKSAVIQMDDYYPFGAVFNTYSRENSLRNQYKYNGGSELQDELGLEVYLTDHRTYDPWGRLGWWQVDPKVDEMYSWSPYNYSFNNPILYNDPKGDCPPDTWCDDGKLSNEDAVNAVAVDIFNAKHSAYNVVLSIVGSNKRATFVEREDGDYETGFVETEMTVGEDLVSLGLDLLNVISVGKGPGVVFAKTTAKSSVVNGVKSAVHGNSKSSKAIQHGYVIKNGKKILEYGISGQKLKANGTSPRVQQKLTTKHKNKPGVRGEVIKPNMVGRQKALNWEAGKVRAYKKASPNRKTSPPNQKRPDPQ